MHFRISRNGQIYGPYTLDDLRRYVASGNVLLDDLAKSDEMEDWVPVRQVLEGSVEGSAPPPATAVNAFEPQPEPQPQPAQAAPSFQQQGQQQWQQQGYAPGFAPPSSPGQPLTASSYPDPPSLNWGLYLLFAILTCGLFSKVFTLIQAAWLKRVQPNSNALLFYGIVNVLWLLSLFINMGRSVAMFAHHVSVRDSPGRHVLTVIYFALLLVTRWVMSLSLEEHFNGPEPIGMRLNPVLSVLFGGVYFQSQLNRVTEMKRAARLASGQLF